VNQIVNNDDNNGTQSFVYDSLNRIRSEWFAWMKVMMGGTLMPVWVPDSGHSCSHSHFEGGTV
jgi:hypothetical protein